MTTMTDQDFDTKFDYFETTRSQLGLSAVWSIFEVDNLNEVHPFVGATKVIYRAYGSGDHEVAINGTTWASLFIAADCIKTRPLLNFRHISKPMASSKSALGLQYFSWVSSL